MFTNAKQRQSLARKLILCLIVAGLLIACSVADALTDFASQSGSSLRQDDVDGMETSKLDRMATASATASLTSTATATTTPTSTATPSPTTTPSPTASRTPSPSPTATDSTEPRVENSTLGISAGERPISVVRAGYSRGVAVIIVGAIDGLQPETSDLVDAVADWYTRDLARIPPGLAFYFIARFNPDGLANGSRFNDRGVDLNRNWDTSDWIPSPPLPEAPWGKLGAGGSYPFSESETQALRDLILTLTEDSVEVLFVVLHASASRPRGETYPGYTTAGEHETSNTLAQGVSLLTGYAYKPGWEEYEVPGEAIHWSAEQGLPSVEIVWPTGSPPDVSLLTSLIDMVAR